MAMLLLQGKTAGLSSRPDFFLSESLSSGDNVQDAGIVSISLSVHTGVITPAGYPKRTQTSGLFSFACAILTYGVDPLSTAL